MGGTAETALGVAAVLVALAAIAMFMLSRAPAARVASIGLLLLAAAIAWLGWSEGGGPPAG